LKRAFDKYVEFVALFSFINNIVIIREEVEGNILSYKFEEIICKFNIFFLKNSDILNKWENHFFYLLLTSLICFLLQSLNSPY
jgi:hypothetical protein